MNDFKNLFYSLSPDGSLNTIEHASGSFSAGSTGKEAFFYSEILLFSNTFFSFSSSSYFFFCCSYNFYYSCSFLSISFIWSINLASSNSFLCLSLSLFIMRLIIELTMYLDLAKWNYLQHRNHLALSASKSFNFFILHLELAEFQLIVVNILNIPFYSNSTC